MSGTIIDHDITKFYHRAKALDGEFRLGEDNHLRFHRYRGAFLGKAVRWARNKLASSQARQQKQKESAQALHALAKSLKAYYGTRAARRVLADEHWTQDRPLLARDVRRLIDKIHKQQSLTLKRIIKTMRKKPDNGYEFLLRLAKHDMLDSDMISRNLARAQFEPLHSSLETARALIAEDGIKLPKAKMQAVYDAVMQAREHGDVKQFYRDLTKADALKDINVAKLFARMPTGFDLRAHGLDCANLYHLVASQFFVMLQSQLPARLYETSQGPALQHRTPAMNSAARAQYQSLVDDISFGDDRIAMQGAHVAPYVDDTTGAFDSQAFWDNLPQHVQFKKDFMRNIHTAEHYNIDGKDYQGKPQEALQALWVASKGQVERFRATCNILTQTPLNAVYDPDVTALATGHPKDSGIGYDASRFMFVGMDPDISFDITPDDRGQMDIRLALHAGLKGGKLLGLMHDLVPKDDRHSPTQHDYQLSDDMAFTRQIKINIALSPSAARVKQADIFCTFDGPVSGLSPAEDA